MLIDPIRSNDRHKVAMGEPSDNKATKMAADGPAYLEWQIKESFCRQSILPWLPCMVPSIFRDNCSQTLGGADTS